jgi:hypothetical protein
MNAQVILLEDGWNRLKTGGVEKIEEILEDMQDGVYKSRISTDEYSQLYTCAGSAALVARRTLHRHRTQEAGAACSLAPHGR